MNAAEPRVAARRDPASAEWFDALREGQLLVRRCPLGHLSRQDVLACDECGATDLSWHAVKGHGTLVSVAVDHSGTEPTRIAVVELAEGPWLLTRIEGAPPTRGEHVVVRVADPAEGEPYPVVTRTT